VKRERTVTVTIRIYEPTVAGEECIHLAQKILTLIVIETDALPSGTTLLLPW
jgi:hypothetical protein